MVGQRLLIIALVASLLLIQLTPTAQAKSVKNQENRNGVQLREGTGTRGTGTGTNEAGGGDGVNAVACFIGIANLVIGQINSLLPSTLIGVSTCITVCNGGDAAACVACVAAAIPAIPLIPTSIAGCG